VLDVRKLRVLAELERLGTVAAVARHLHLTASAISMQLSALEREAGLPLTERNGRTVALTPAGRLLARHGHDIADMVTVAEMDVAALREGTAGTYRVAAFPSAAATFVADAWAGLRREPGTGPAMHLVELEPQDALPALAAGDVDLAIVHSYSNLPELPSPALTATPLVTEDVLLAVAAGQPDAGQADLSDYAHHDWVLPHARWTCHEMVIRACAAAGFTPRAVATATDFAVQLALVRAGVGVALVPGLACIAVPAEVTLHGLRTPVRRHISFATRVSSRSDVGIDALRRAIATSARTTIPAIDRGGHR
jgi:DNA-binding transcriptional LysR family regulator